MTSSPARDDLGRLLDVPEGASPEEIAEAVARRDAADAANLAHFRRLGIRNGVGPGWA